MNTEEKWLAFIAAFVVTLIASAVFWTIGAIDADEKRNDHLQEQCIAKGGNWSYGCDMKPVKD